MNANERKSMHKEVVAKIVAVLAESYGLNIENDLPLSMGDVKIHELIDEIALDLVLSFGFCIQETNNGLAACIMGMASQAEFIKCKTETDDCEEDAQDDNTLS